MKAEETINRIRGALADHLSGYEQKSENRVYIEVPPEVVIEAAQLMFEEVGARLQIATGLDTGQGIEVMYHWALDTEDCVVTVRVTVPYEAPVLESITGICPAAEWIEREMWELLGVEFHGHPDMRHLLLDDDWPEDDYPLRKTVGAGHARDSDGAGQVDSGNDLGCAGKKSHASDPSSTSSGVGPNRGHGPLLQEEPQP